MAEYIDRDTIIARIQRQRGLLMPTLDGNDFIADSAYRCAIEFISRIPSADVAPVKHGKWKWEMADNGWANHICSECGWTKNTDIHVYLDYNYCPVCGARMDGE